MASANRNKHDKAIAMDIIADSHIHLDDPRFDADRQQLIHDAQQQGIRYAVVPSTCLTQWSRAQQVSQHHPGIAVAYGIHPLFLHPVSEAELALLRQQLLMASPKACAIGEIGLDFHAPETDQPRQLYFFEQQLNLALELDLPVIIHARQAMDLIIARLRRHPGIRGVVHAFAGSHQQAEQLLQLGMYLGVGGTVTYPRAQRLRQIIQDMPLDRLLLETDAPYQPLCGHQGQRNIPVRLMDILHCVASLRGIQSPQLARHTLDNTCRLFGLSISTPTDIR